MGSVFGVGTTEVFAAAQTNIWRSTDNGLTWSPQALPVTGRYMFRKISGTPNNIHAAGFYSYSGDAGWILRFDGASWQLVYSGTVQGLDVISPTEGYFVACWGWGRWDGASWSYVPQGWDFCDVGPMAAFREPSGAFHWWTAGNNNWANGVRVWCFDTNTMSFGSKRGYCFADGDGYLVGGAYGLWGASATDVYVVGGLTAANQGQQSARAYHFDGTSWSRINEVAGAGALYDVCGTSGNNVWMCGANGRLLHYGEVAGLSPHVACPPPAVLECGVSSQVTAQVSDPEGDAMAVVWVLNGTAIQTNSVPAAPPGTVFDVPLAGAFPLGTNILAIGVTDGANTASCTTSITVVDTTPPVISHVVASPSVLWPPNHRMVRVNVRASVSDTCSPAAWRIVRVRSNEPVNGRGHGNTSPDWRITGDHTLLLRAERSARGSGRVYYVSVQATDAAGNQSQMQTVTVTVPERKGPARR